MRHRYFGWVAQRLIDDAIALRQANKCTQLVLGCVGIHVHVQANTLKSNRCILGDTQRAAKIEIAFGADRAAVNSDANRCRDGVERHPRTGHERLEEHVTGAGAEAVASGSRMQSCRNESLAGLHIACDSLAQATLGP